MSCNPDITELPDCITGDTWPGFSYAVTSDGTTLSEPLASARMSFALQPSGTVALTLTSSAGITIDNAAAWQLTVEKILSMPLAPEFYLASIELTDTAGNIRTFSRFSIAILSDPTT